LMTAVVIRKRVSATWIGYRLYIELC
jgi:hypothetical protein